MTPSEFDRWLAAYFHAWQSSARDEVAALFGRDAVYHYGPFGRPTVGRRQIVERWVDQVPRQERVVHRYEPLCVHGRRGIAHWNVSFELVGDPGGRHELDGILLLDFDDENRCVRHQEWYVSRRLEPPDSATGTGGRPTSG